MQCRPIVACTGIVGSSEIIVHIASSTTIINVLGDTWSVLWVIRDKSTLVRTKPPARLIVWPKSIETTCRKGPEPVVDDARPMTIKGLAVYEGLLMM